jgi:hypothetical protein
MITLLNGYYVDDNNNRWNSSIYTLDQAAEDSATLINCNRCTNCANCSSCDSCTNCDRCDNCNHCNHCTDCGSCNYCTSCDSCTDCNSCNYCASCDSCTNCFSCTTCRRISSWKANPMLYVTSRIGSRNAQTYFYFDATRTEVICGCWSGTLEDFESRVNRVYGKKSPYRKQYHKYIKIMKSIIKGVNKR